MVGGRNKRKIRTGWNDRSFAKTPLCSSFQRVVVYGTAGGGIHFEQGGCWPRNRPPPNRTPTVMIYNV